MAWKFRMTKIQHGTDGKYFEYPGSGYETAEEAIAAAKKFAQCQKTCVKTKIIVMTRKNPRCIFEINPYLPEYEEKNWQ